ncbi:hypothetical protein [Streptosporangium sp. NPDC002721]|uniref:hypothetical protein n=1 Tax=Streptosporangium sp. NPDC002721 TaxID=3366188 RepID=UPI00369446E7
MASSASAIRAARTVVRAKTTPYTGAHLRYLVWVLVPLAALAWKLGATAAMGAALASGMAYVAGTYAGLSHAWKEEAPYTVELEDGEEPPDCRCFDR